MKKNMLIIISMILLPCMQLRAEDLEYKDWDHEDVVGIYEEISAYEAFDYGYDMKFEDGDNVRYFSRVRIKSGVYEVEVKEKIDSKFWGIAYTSYFMKFRYNPYLYRYDEGILEWDGYDGVFYKEP